MVLTFEFLTFEMMLDVDSQDIKNEKFKVWVRTTWVPTVGEFLGQFGHTFYTSGSGFL